MSGMLRARMAQGCRETPSPLVGEGRGGGSHRPVQNELPRAKFESSARTPSLTLPRKGVGNRALAAEGGAS